MSNTPSEFTFTWGAGALFMGFNASGGPDGPGALIAYKMGGNRVHRSWREFKSMDGFIRHERRVRNRAALHAKRRASGSRKARASQ